jgi:hypothetical protein
MFPTGNIPLTFDSSFVSFRAGTAVDYGTTQFNGTTQVLPHLPHLLLMCAAYCIGRLLHWLLMYAVYFVV